MQVQSMKIDEVKPYPNNPRNNDDGVEAVANSIKQFGWQQPIVVDKDNVIIVGHTRYKAAKKLGMDKIPVVVASNLSPEQVKAYRLADNKTGELTDWDMSLLDDELGDIADIDMSDFGFDLDIPEDDEEVQEDDFDEEVPEEPKSKLGQIYQLGRHRLMCGDSTNPEMVKKLVGGGAM
nr:MAG TPA: ParB protein [Caudoviricetes sp.]